MAGLRGMPLRELFALGTPEAFAEIDKREQLLGELDHKDAVIANQRALLEAQVITQRRERLRQALPSALAHALLETRMYHRSLLTGRCGFPNAG
jgi:hypothetical protein